jgi:hypothetical protein
VREGLQTDFGLMIRFTDHLQNVHKQENNIEMDLISKELEGMDWIYLNQDTVGLFLIA